MIFSLPFQLPKLLFRETIHKKHSALSGPAFTLSYLRDLKTWSCYHLQKSFRNSFDTKHFFNMMELIYEPSTRKDCKICQKWRKRMNNEPFFNISWSIIHSVITNKTCFSRQMLLLQWTPLWFIHLPADFTCSNTDKLILFLHYSMISS